MNRVNFEVITKELLSLREDYQHNKPLHNRLEKIINQHRINMEVVKEIITNIK